jgi:hypothetical protein
VLKHETREAERVQFPFDEGFGDELADSLPLIDETLRTAGPEAGAAIADRIFVRHQLLSDRELDQIRRSRAEMHARRVTRGRTT